jgi:hypothetical protein
VCEAAATGYRIAMTEQTPPRGSDLDRARQAAALHTAVSGDLEEFLRRVPAVPDPADVTEYAALLAREQAVRAERDEAVAALGLAIPSVEPE